MCGKCPWREPVGCLGGLQTGGWVGNGGIPVEIPQPLLPKMPTGPPAPPSEPLPESPSLPGSSPSPAPRPHQRQGQGQRGTRGEMGPHLGQGWLISLNPPTQGEAASIIAKLRAWRLLTLAPPGSVGWDVGNSRSGSPHPGPGSSFSRAVSVTHYNRGLGHSG